MSSNLNLKRIELRPVEWDGLILLSNPKKTKERIEIPVANISDVRIISETKGHIRKKEDLMIQITYKDNTGNQDNVVVVNLENKYANECFQLIQSLRQKAS